jgi:hypothetical protein
MIEFKNKVIETKAIDKQTHKETNVTFEESTIILDGKSFTSQGSFISDKWIFAYIDSKKSKITTWEGKLLSDKIEILGEYYNPFDIYRMNEGFYLRFLYNGKVYSGISPNGCYIKAKVTKLKNIWS